MSTKLWIDPPSGWMYGFPKVYDPVAYPDLKQWLLDSGYPLSQVDFALRYLRQWKVEN